MSKSLKVRSRYITDVIFMPDKYVELIDSNSISYYFDYAEISKKTDLAKKFSKWYQTIFLNGVNQYLLVFSYEIVDHDGQADMIIKLIFNKLDVVKEV